MGAVTSIVLGAGGFKAPLGFLTRREPSAKAGFAGRSDGGQGSEVGRAGIEPATLGLKVPCSTD
jgi:hypothetical protein